MRREVWAEFGDGSVAKYGVEDDDLPRLLTLLSTQAGTCTLWVDGELWKPNERIDTIDPDVEAD